MKACFEAGVITGSQTGLVWQAGVGGNYRQLKLVQDIASFCPEDNLDFCLVENRCESGNSR
jgi:hypothetical protein